MKPWTEPTGNCSGNALWPRTMVATAAVEHALGGESAMRRSRKPEIVADAAYAILNREARHYTGRFVLDEDVLREEGRQSFAEYQVDPTQALEPDLFVRETRVRESPDIS